MADTDEITVTGLDQLADALDKMPYRFAQNIMRNALHAGAEVFMAEMQARAPVAPQASHPESAPGELRDSIGVMVRLGKDLDSSTAKIGPMYDKSRYSGKNRTHSPGIYAKFVEWGTVKMSAKPFIRPAFWAAKETAVDTFVKVVDSLVHLLVAGPTTGQLGE